MNKKDEKSKWLSRDIQPKGPYLCLCLTEQEYINALKQLDLTPKNDWLSNGSDGTTHTFINGNTRSCIVCLKKQKTVFNAYSIIVHEAVHVWQDYKDQIGEKSPAVEQEAYGIQYISSILLEEYQRKTGAKK
jgi:hypothetical protein